VADGSWLVGSGGWFELVGLIASCKRFKRVMGFENPKFYLKFSCLAAVVRYMIK
jgi:hypothetical protein